MTSPISSIPDTTSVSPILQVQATILEGYLAKKTFTKQEKTAFRAQAPAAEALLNSSELYLLAVKSNLTDRITKAEEFVQGESKTNLLSAVALHIQEEQKSLDTVDAELKNIQTLRVKLEEAYAKFHIRHVKLPEASDSRNKVLLASGIALLAAAVPLVYRLVYRDPT